MQQTTIWCNLYAGTIMITPFIPENVSVFKSLVLKHWMFVLQWITSWKRSSFSLMFRCYHSLQAGNFPLAELSMWTLPAPLQSKSTQLLQTWWQFQLLGFIPKQHKLQQPSTKSTYGCVLNYRSTGTAPIDHLHNYFNDKDPPMSRNQSWPRHKFGGITAQNEHFLHPWGQISKATRAPEASWLMLGTFFHPKKTQVPRFPHLNTQGESLQLLPYTDQGQKKAQRSTSEHRASSHTHHLCLHLAWITFKLLESLHLTLGPASTAQAPCPACQHPRDPKKLSETWEIPTEMKSDLSPTACPPPEPCHDVSFQRNGLQGTAAQPGHGQGRTSLKVRPELFSPWECEGRAEKQRPCSEETHKEMGKLFWW